MIESWIRRWCMLFNAHLRSQERNSGGINHEKIEENREGCRRTLGDNVRWKGKSELEREKIKLTTDAKSWRLVIQPWAPSEIMLEQKTDYTHNTYTMNTDRRRNNAPSGGTSAPVFARTVKEPEYLENLRPTRSRGPNELRRICR
jgi:hypothetical protein